MSMVSVPSVLASAAVVVFGRYGSVVRLSQQRGVSRQRLYREAHVVLEAIHGQRHHEQVQRLQQQVQQLQRQLAQRQRQEPWTVVVDADKQAQFAATAQALGVSLSATQALFEVLLGAQAPSRSQLGRAAQAAGRQAKAVLAVLDSYSGARARQVAADEIFVGRKPVLMTVEQQSLCWLGGRLVQHRDGESWAAEYQRLPSAEQVTGDRGQGLRKGLAMVNEERRKAGLAAIAEQSDHFHPLRRAQQQRRGLQARAEHAFKQAEQAQRDALRATQRTGRRCTAKTKAVKRAWQRAEQAMDHWSAQEKVHEQLRASLQPFTATGELRTPEQAQAEVQACLAQLDGTEGDKIRRGLGAEAFTYLRRAHEQLQALPVPPPLVQAAVRVEGLTRQPEVLRGAGPQAGALRGVLLVASVVLALAKEVGAQALSLVRGVLQQASRASSLVEGLNSVVRMHQSRQKRLSQELLDLKRLHWNLHQFRAGKRKGQSPYGRMGLKLPTDHWWELLKIPPEQLRDELSALNGPV